MNNKLLFIVTVNVVLFTITSSIFVQSKWNYFERNFDFVITNKRIIENHDYVYFGKKSMIISNRIFYNKLLVGDSIYKKNNSWYMHIYRKDMKVSMNLNLRSHRRKMIYLLMFMTYFIDSRVLLTVFNF